MLKWMLTTISWLIRRYDMDDPFWWQYDIFGEPEDDDEAEVEIGGLYAISWHSYLVRSKEESNGRNEGKLSGDRSRETKS